MAEAKETREENPWTREWFVRLENLCLGDETKAKSGFQCIVVMYASENDMSTRGPLLDAILHHFGLPERVRPYLRIWTTPFRTHRLHQKESERIPSDIEFLYVGV